MRRALALLLLICSVASTALAASATHARLILAAQTAKPGDTVLAGIELKMDPGWHTYWRNPGVGIPTSVRWTLPPGVTAGEIQWPVPEKLIFGGLLTYVYHTGTILLVPLKISPEAAAGPISISGKVSWLECQKECVPGSSTVTASLTIGPATRASSDAAKIEAAQKTLPQSGAARMAKAFWEKPAQGDSRSLILEWKLDKATAEPDFYSYGAESFEVLASVDKLQAAAGQVRIRKTVKKLEGAWPKAVAGLLVEKVGSSTFGFEESVPIADEGPAVNPADAPPLPVAVNPAPAPGKSIWLWLGYAFLGGLILNVMPCVLPVIALKILGFVNQGQKQPGQIRTLGLLYTLGVLVSFLVLAGIVIGVKAAGQKAGWGMQFGNPQFIVILTVVVTLVALNLFGVFEVNLGGGAMQSAGDLAARHGKSGAFFNGVLATVLATPCTAPFLGAALGFAFVQPPPVIALFFLVIGAGLAAPYLLLSWNPAWLKFLPKPGVWMERFKVAMGFPVAATAIWLLSLTVPHYGGRFWWLGIFLVLVALAAWVFGQFIQRGGKRRGLALAVVGVLLVGGYAFAIEDKLQWRSPVVEAAGAEDSIQEVPGGIIWHRWSPEAVARARSEGHPVLVDFTAKWCLTCQVNRDTSIEIASVRQKLKDLDAVALIADNTKFPPAIAVELEKFQRAGVPLVVVYPKDASRPPIPLPDGFLTPGIVLDALDKASK